MAIKILSLDGLNDAKLCELTSQLLETIPGVQSARIEFLSQKLTMDISGRDESETINDVVSTLETTIPGVSVSRTDVGTDEPAVPGQDVPGRDDGPSFKPRPGQEEETKKKRRIKLSADATLYTVGLALGAALIAASFLFQEGSFPSRLLLGISLGLTALFSLFFQWNGRFGGYRIITLVTIDIAAMVFYLDQPLQAAGAMAFYLGGTLGVYLILERFDAATNSLISIHPEKLVRLREGELEQVPLEKVLPGDRILLRTGDTIPFDGLAAEGDAQVDASLLTGNTEPVRVKAGMGVHCGDRILRGPLTVEVAAPQKHSPVFHLSAAVTKAPSKTQSSSQLRKWLVLWTIALVLCAGGSAFLLFRPGPVEEWVVDVLTVLLLATPCGVFAEFALRGGLARAISDGILIRSGEALDDITRVKTVVTSYSGIMTQGEYRVARVSPAEEVQSSQLLEKAAFAEYACPHPVAQAVTEYYEESTNKKISESRSSAGEISRGGVRAMVGRTTILAGSERYLRESEVSVPKNETGRKCVYVSESGEFIGRLELEEPYRPGATSLAANLRAKGIERTVLLTSCDAEVGMAAQSELGFDEVYAEKDMEEKRDSILFLAGRDEATVLYASGLDELELFDSCIGVAMGVDHMGPPLSAAKAVIPSSDPGKLVDLVKAAKGVRSALILNFCLGVAVKAALLICAAFWVLPYFAAAAANAAVCAFAAWNAVRAYR